ncbi:glpV, partial [Symbiodinium necroappetens]
MPSRPRLNFAIILIEADADATCYPHYANKYFECPTRSSSILWLAIVEIVFIVIYVSECVARVYVERAHFLCSSWNLVDLTTVLLGCLQLALADTVNLSLLRLSRIARVLKAVRLFISVPELYMLIGGLYSSLKAIVFGAIMLIVMILVWAVVSVEMLHPIASVIDFPGTCERCSRGFADIFSASVTIFQQIVAGDSWGAISIPLVERAPATAILLFAIMLTISVGLMNLILAVIVERAAEARENDHAKKVQQKEAERSRSMEDLVLLCAGMDINANGMISYQELLKGYDRVNDFQKLMDVMDITRDDLESIFYVLDADASGEVSYLEFCSSLGTFFKREPIIMHSLVRYSVMEIRKILRQEVLSILDHHTEMLQEQRAMMEVNKLASQPEAVWKVGQANDPTSHGQALQNHHTEDSLRTVFSQEEPRSSLNPALDSVQRIDHQLRLHLARAEELARAAVDQHISTSAGAGWAQEVPKPNLRSCRSQRTRSPFRDPRAHRRSGESIDDKFVRICRGFRERMQEAETLQEDFRKIVVYFNSLRASSTDGELTDLMEALTCTYLQGEFGLSRVEVIDVEYVKGDDLKKAVAALGKVDVVWAEMGNTYALRHHLRDSGGDQLVFDAMDAGAIYVGSSAGSIVAGRTVQMAFWKDWDDKTAEGTIDVDWKTRSCFSWGFHVLLSPNLRAICPSGVMTTSGVWSPSNAGFEMKRKTSFSLLDNSVRRPMPAAKPGGEEKMAKLWKLMEHYEPNDQESIKKSFARHLEYSLACTRFNFSMQDAYRAAGFALRDRLIESLNDTEAHYREKDVKRGYYLSAEYLIGRHMQNAIANLDLERPFQEAFMDLGIQLEELFSQEADPALGNGGLGRLAACFLDSMATMSLPCWGYGIRYSYGMFKQQIENGRQVEQPDCWIGDGCPFEIPRPDVTYPIRFYGHVEEVEVNGKKLSRWVGGEIVQAMAYDNPIPGFDTFNTNNLRLWRACPSKEFDLDAYNSAQFSNAIDQRRRAEDLSAVLYPNDATYEGKELRLRQQYFFVSASLQVMACKSLNRAVPSRRFADSFPMQDVLRDFIKRPSYQWSQLPDKVAVQMNDTHPTIAVAEMMRLLVDVQQMDWYEAWDLTRKCLNYTNHTVMPEALEKWPVEMMERILPRHVQIIGEINWVWIRQLIERYGDGPIIQALSIFE